MKYKDIVYELKNSEIVPFKMGVVSTEICDNNAPLKCYIKNNPDVNKAVKMCNENSLNNDINNCISKEIAPPGYYKKYVHFFIVFVKNETSIAYYPRIAFGQSRHWINGKLAFIGHCEDGKYATIYTCILKKGYNIFCVEHISDDIPLIKIDIGDRNDEKSLTENNLWFEKNEFVINYKSVNIFNNELFEFNLIPVDLVNLCYESKMIMTVKSDSSNNILFQKKVSFKKEYKIDLSSIEIEGEDEYNQMIIQFKGWNKSGECFEKNIRIFRKYPKKEFIEYLKNQSTCLLNQEAVPDLIKNEIKHHLKELNDNDTIIGKYLKRIIEISKTNNWNEYLFSPGPHYIYYYSEEDDSYYYYYIVLPKNYSKSKKYPLLLTISHGHIENKYDLEDTRNYSYRLSKVEETICADVCGRGATLGSYMGETFFLNELKNITNNFSIDKKRIYAVAHCAGNYSLFNIAQTHPDVFAGIYARKAELYNPNIKNLYNVFFMYFISSYGKDDPVWKMRETLKKSIKEYKYIYVKEQFNEDIDLRRVQYTFAAINKLMNRELNEYPDYIYYRTERNRVLKSYYLEIESIEGNSTYALIECRIINKKIIIKAEHCSGIRITIPPKLRNKRIGLYVNGKTILNNQFVHDQIILKHIKKKGYIITDNFSKAIEIYKGSGLIDVYFKPVRIINCDTNNSIMGKVARVFAMPISNAAYSTIYVDYPIISSLDFNSYLNTSYIIIDNNCSGNPLIETIKKNLKIQMDSRGFQYRNEYKEGKYCIMQIAKHPLFPECSVLFVNTNDVSLYKKNIFTRILIIPNYGSGYNPYLNCVALFFDGKNYYSVDNWSEKFTKISSNNYHLSIT